MLDKIVSRFAQFVHEYPMLAFADIASVVALIAYMVLA